MRNISLQKASVCVGVLSFWALMILMCSGASAQVNWTNCGNGYQTRVVGTVREYRVIMTTGYSPLMLTDSLAKKLNLADSVIKYVTPTMLNEAIAGATIPDATTIVKGKLKLAGDLSGTADLPMVPGLALKVDKVTGKGLSTEDYTTAEKNKLAGIAAGATANQTDSYLLSRTNHTGTQAMSTVTGLEATLDGKINLIQKGVANGVASLGADGKVPNSQIPALAISETFVVSSQSAMLAISGADQGDVAVRTDISKSFILTASPASTLGNWQELLAPTDAVQSVNGQVGNVNLTTTNIPEGTNLYYTNARVNAVAPTLTGTGATGTWPIGITGNSETTNKWGGNTFSGTESSVAPNYILGAYSGSEVKYSNATALRSFISGATLNNSISGNAATATTSSSLNGTAILTNNNNFDSAPFSFIGKNSGSDNNLYTYSPLGARLALGMPSGGETLQSVTDRGTFTTNPISIGQTSALTGVSFSVRPSVTNGTALALLNRNATKRYDHIVDVNAVDDGMYGFYDRTTGAYRYTIANNGNFQVGYVADQSYKFAVNGAGYFNNKLTVLMDGAGNGNGVAVRAATSAAAGSQPGYEWLSNTGSHRYDMYLDVTNDNLNITNAGRSSVLFSINQSGSTSFLGNVTAPSFIGNLTGSASAWGGNTFVGSASDVAPNYLAGYYSGSEAKYSTQTAVRLFLGLGSNAYTSTAYLPLSSNAVSATVLQTARTINGVSFNGSANITVADATKYSISGGEVEGVMTVKMNSPVSSVVLDAGGYIRGADFIVNSDSTLKKNITPLTNSVHNLMKLQGYSYDWKRDGKHAIGVVAQEIQKVYPEIVFKDDKGILNVDYSKLVAPLIQANNEQQKEINQLKKDIEELKSLIKR